MAASNPSSLTTYWHFSGPPAMPTTRQPLILPIWPDDAAHGSRGRGDDKRLAGLRLADLEQAKIGGHARHAQRAEIHGQGGRFAYQSW